MTFQSSANPSNFFFQQSPQLEPSDAFLQRKGCEVYNIGFTVSSPSFTIHAADGSAFSAANPGYVALEGTVYEITANLTFQDSTGTNSLSGNRFGTQTGDDWGANLRLPFFLYIVKDTSTDDYRFGISRLAYQTITSNFSSEIGFPGTPATSAAMFWLFSSVTAANYTQAHCYMLGTFEMEFRQTTSDDWVLGNTAATGMGLIAGDRYFSMAQAVQGAATGSIFYTNGGTAPVGGGFPSYTLQPGYYRYINRGTVTGTAGVGAVDLRAAVPLGAVAGFNQDFVVGSFFASNTTYTETGVVEYNSNNIYITFRRNGGTRIQNADLNTGSTLAWDCYIPGPRATQGV